MCFFFDCVLRSATARSALGVITPDTELRESSVAVSSGSCVPRRSEGEGGGLASLVALLGLLSPWRAGDGDGGRWKRPTLAMFALTMSSGPHARPQSMARLNGTASMAALAKEVDGN